MRKLRMSSYILISDCYKWGYWSCLLRCTELLWISILVMHSSHSNLMMKTLGYLHTNEILVFLSRYPPLLYQRINVIISSLVIGHIFLTFWPVDKDIDVDLEISWPVMRTYIGHTRSYTLTCWKCGYWSFPQWYPYLLKMRILVMCPVISSSVKLRISVMVLVI
jgi:hypothetical protein